MTFSTSISNPRASSTRADPKIQRQSSEPIHIADLIRPQKNGRLETDEEIPAQNCKYRVCLTCNKAKAQCQDTDHLDDPCRPCFKCSTLMLSLSRESWATQDSGYGGEEYSATEVKSMQISRCDSGTSEPRPPTMSDSVIHEGAKTPNVSVWPATPPEERAYGHGDDAPRIPKEKCSRKQGFKRNGVSLPSIEYGSGIYSDTSEILESPKEEFLDKLFEENGSFTTCSPTTSSGSQGGSNSSQSNTTPSSSLPSDYSQRTGAPNKRKRTDQDDEEWNRPNGSRKQGGSGPSETSEQGGQRGRRLACHFYLFDKETYSKNNRTGKRYETCSGPGWASMHHLKQHLGNATSSFHKRIRCPRCLNAFKTANAVLKHQKANPGQCRQQSSLDPPQDDVDDLTWERVDNEITRQGFQRLEQSEQDEINLWVLGNLENETQNQLVEERKWELRKWNMTWRILFPSYIIPASPFYDDEAFMSLTNTELLVKSFKETVELALVNGDIDGIDDETLDYLLGSLRVAISVSSSSNRQQRDLLRRRLLNATLKTVAPASSKVASDRIIIEDNPDKLVALAPPTPSILPMPVNPSVPMEHQQLTEMYEFSGTMYPQMTHSQCRII